MPLIDPPANGGAMREEIFGPLLLLLPLVPSDRFESAIAFVNACRLTKRYWSGSARRCPRT
jgi:acyl-CoA reductase-like NAD-dependent aldehyde dehydrogenase